MKNFLKKNKLFKHLLIVLIFQLILLSFQVKPDNNKTLITKIVIGITTPIQSGSDYTLRWIAEQWNSLANLRNVQKENWKLRDSVRELKEQLVVKRELHARIKLLEDLLNFHDHYTIKSEPALVTGYNISAQHKHIFINKGSSSGVKQFSPVVNTNGLVGLIIVATPVTSQVQLITDGNSSISVITEESRARGILRGIDDDSLSIDYLDKAERVTVGEKVLTSGLDDIFPEGLLVGYVSNVNKGDELFLEVIVKPAVDFLHLESVLIILQESTIKTEEMKIFEESN